MGEGTVFAGYSSPYALPAVRLGFGVRNRQLVPPAANHPGEPVDVVLDDATKRRAATAHRELLLYGRTLVLR